MKGYYSVKEVVKMAGVSIRALHLYDGMELLVPAVRAESGYRYYSEKELLRLQQILFYKELGIPLKEIALILDDPDFDILEALQNHKKALQQKKDRISTLLKTIDKTINSLKDNTMINAEDLYEGMSAGQAQTYRKEAINNYGQEAVETAENHLKKMNKEEIKALVARQKEMAALLFKVMNKTPESNEVQVLIKQHYINTRKLWGTEGIADKQAEAYKGLGLLYLTDERFTLVNDEFNREFAAFLSKAMAIYADKELV